MSLRMVLSSDWNVKANQPVRSTLTLASILNAIPNGSSRALSYRAKSRLASTTRTRRPKPESQHKLTVLCLPQMPLIDPTAAQSTFRFFYHYQRFEKNFLINMLRDQMLFSLQP